MKISPNPSNGNISIHHDDLQKETEIWIYDLLGNTVHHNKYSEKEIIINDLPKGIYFVAISCGNLNSIEKLVIQ